MYTYMIKINEPQLPWLRTAVIYHTDIDVKNGSHPMYIVHVHCICTLNSGWELLTQTLQLPSLVHISIVYKRFNPKTFAGLSGLHCEYFHECTLNGKYLHILQ